MDNDKLGDKSTIGILDPTRVSQASYTIILNKNSEMYRNMSQEDFNKQVKEQTGTVRSKVALYIARAIQAFVKDGRTNVNMIMNIMQRFGAATGLRSMCIKVQWPPYAAPRSI
jgi:hypothetical protein